MPDYIKQGGDRGSAVRTEDVPIPRLEVVQPLSPCLKEGEPEYIEGIRQGDIYNTITWENYGNSIVVVPIFFRKQYLVWAHKRGQGFGGAYSTPEEADQARKTRERPDEWTVTDTGQHLVLIIHENGATEEAMLSLARTSEKVSRQFNTLVRINGYDRFSRQYALFSVDDSSPKGDYKNFAVANYGFPTTAVYDRAKALYEAVSTCERELVMDNKEPAGDSFATAF